MVIKKKLIIDQSSEPTAVLINDEGEEYPVFLETLHNTVIFPLLLESGYKLTSLPYGFTKDGVSFDQLPTEHYQPTDIQLEQMYNSIGVKLSYDEIKSHIDVQEATGIQTPPTNYTIHTRQELLEFLDAVEKASAEVDFMPLNYFVAPEARFSIDEYQDTVNHRYVGIITKRREMTLSKFYNLVGWLLNKHLIAQNYTAQDVIDAYFSWGMDGLNHTMLNRRRESRAFRLQSNTHTHAPVLRKTPGFLDGAGNMLTPANERDVVWRLPSKDPEYIAKMTANMGVNETRVVQYVCDAMQDVSIIEGPEYNIVYSQDVVIINGYTYTPLMVVSPVSANTFIDINLALPNNQEALVDYCELLALSSMLYDIRKPKFKTSSYNALSTVGANPNTALNYVLAKFDITKERREGAMQSDDSMPTISPFEVANYLAGKVIDEDKKEFLEDIVNGVFNIDRVSSGKSAEASINPEALFETFYAIHHVMGISIQDIYDKLRNLQNGEAMTVFSNGDYQHVIDVAPLKYSVNGYLTDVQTYDIQCADTCTFFSYVTLIAREVGVETCRRHVGIEFFMVNRSKSGVKAILDQLVSMYEEKVSTTIANATQQTKALRFKNVFALSRFFEVALKGTITWTKDLGAAVVQAPSDMQLNARAHLETKIENITTYCDFTVNSVSSATLSFNAYCVNAYITPTYVIPRGKSPIKEVPFYSAWIDYEHENPEIYNQLIGLGVLPTGFRSWSSRYLDQQFKQRNLEDYNDTSSLYYYFDNAVKEVNEYPSTKEFQSVTHPVEYMYPGVIEEQEEMPDLPAPRQELPVIRLGAKRDITIDDYKDKLYPMEAIEDENSAYIREFMGFNIEAFMLLGAEALFRVPAEDKTPITVMQRMGKIYLTDTDQTLDFTRITELDQNKYPVVNVYGRVWLLRSTDGRLWEARI